MEMGSDESLVEHFRADVRGAVIRGVATNSVTNYVWFFLTRHYSEGAWIWRVNPELSPTFHNLSIGNQVPILLGYNAEKRKQISTAF